MRTFHLISGVGVAIVAAWLAVTNLAYADEFTCTIPWSGGTYCSLPKFNIPPQAILTIEVYSLQKDGKDIGGPVSFTVQDANRDNLKVHTINVDPRNSTSWKYDSKETPLTAQLYVNHGDTSTLVVRGRYTVTK